MKQHIYKVVALTILILTLSYVFVYWIDTKLIVSKSCGHREKTVATIVGISINGKNDIGEDVSCYINYNRDGKIVKSQYWNIGNCDVGREVEIDYNSYICD